MKVPVRWISGDQKGCIYTTMNTSSNIHKCSYEKNNAAVPKIPKNAESHHEPKI